MAITNKGVAATSLQEVKTAAYDAYDNGFQAAESSVAPIVTVQPVPNKAYVHNFIPGIPSEREWLDERVSANVQIASFAGQTKNWERTLPIPMEDILGNLLSGHMATIQQFGDQAKRFADRRVANILVNGESTTTGKANYDGNALFATGRSIGDGLTQSNLRTSSALTKTNLFAAIAQMRGMLDAEGNPLDVTPKYIIVTPTLEPTALELTKAALYSNTSNIITSQYPMQVITLPEYTGTATDWFLVGGGNPLFMHYEFQPPQYTQLLDPTDYNVFWKDEGVFGVTIRGEVEAPPYQWVMKCKA